MKCVFNFLETCKRFNVDPKKTSYNNAQCLYYGLPQNSSAFKIECKKYNLNPETTSQNKLTAAGSDLYKHS